MMTTHNPNTPTTLSDDLSIKRLYWLPSLSPFGYRLVFYWFLAVFVVSMARLASDYFHSQIPLLVFDGLLWLLFLGLLVGLLLSLLPLLMLRLPSSFMYSVVVHRQLNHNLSVYEPSLATLLIDNDQTPPSWLVVAVHDVLPQAVVVSDMPLVLDKQVLSNFGGDEDWQGQLKLEYTVTAFERGEYVLDRTHWRTYSPFGIWYDSYEVRDNEAMLVRVFANFRHIGRTPLQAIANKNTINGLIRERLRGQGQDFHQIRAYQEGDSLRQVDWRATARQNRLMSKEYQNEKEQSILFLMDGSQNMRHKRLVGDELDGFFVSHLDTVLNAMLRLSTLAIKQNDAVGFISFSGQNDVIATPKKGVSAMNYLLNQSFAIHTSLDMPDYIGVAKMALALLKKRSLVILMTSTRSENSEELLTAVKLLHGKHLVVVANLYEEDLAQFLQKTPVLAQSAKTQQVIATHLATQNRLMSQLQAIANVETIHCTPDKLANRLTQSYVRLKQRQAW